jgi:hypothetical protein
VSPGSARHGLTCRLATLALAGRGVAWCSQGSVVVGSPLAPRDLVATLMFERTDPAKATDHESSSNISRLSEAAPSVGATAARPESGGSARAGRRFSGPTQRLVVVVTWT